MEKRVVRIGNYEVGISQIVGFIGELMVIIGCFLPLITSVYYKDDEVPSWINIGRDLKEVNDSIIVILIAIILIVLFIFRKKIFAFLFSLMELLIVSYSIYELKNQLGQFSGFNFYLGSGAYIVIIGSIIGLLASILMFSSRRRIS